MGLGNKHRQIVTAERCKHHLREKYADRLSLVEEFIHEFEGTEKNRDILRWSLFVDTMGVEHETVARLDEYFMQWLNP